MSLLVLSISMLPGTVIAAAQPATTTAAVPFYRIELSSGFCLISTPPGYRLGEHPPLIVCLHETDTGAGAILDFWRRLKTPLGTLLVAPEHHMPGWREADLPCIRAMLAYLAKNLSYDARRVLLTGYSAGGAMAFYLLYAENFPATAVAATANYVPPVVTAKMVAAHRDVPIFYAVGEHDINHDRMRSSLELLQANGGALTLLRPSIGHTLDPAVGQQAMDWFVATMISRSMDDIESARQNARDRCYASGLTLVEPILAQRQWHPPEVVSKAERVFTELEAPGIADLAKAENLARRGQYLAALDLLRTLETVYGSSRLGNEARNSRERLEADPTVRSADKARQAAQIEQASRQALARAQWLAAERHYDQARQQCHAIIQMYPGSTAATRASTLLEQLRRSGRQTMMKGRGQCP